ncbi:HotDog domain-containing protein [Gloeopeniophorella convolvens]|nr:HotDog domain-containing protein [Gloeopeniophorella convolvens]
MFRLPFRRVPTWSGVRPFASSASTSSPTSSRVLRTLRYASLAITAGTGVYTVGALYPPTLLTFISPRPAPPPPDPDLPETKAYVAALEEQLLQLPLLLEHRATENSEEWYETRPYISLPEERRVNNLTAGALRGPGRLALPPLVRARRDESENLIIVHVGRGLCGHDGIVHGGLLATLLDEALARVATQNLPEKIGVTANLTVNYRAPTRAEQFIVFRIKLLEAKGRKTRVQGRVEDLDGNLLADATATFVQPKYAKFLNKNVVLERIGERPAVEQSKRSPEEVLPRPVALSAQKTA